MISTVDSVKSAIKYLDSKRVKHRFTIGETRDREIEQYITGHKIAKSILVQGEYTIRRILHGNSFH